MIKISSPPRFCSSIALLLTACADSHAPISPSAPAPAPLPTVYNPEQHARPLTLSQFHDIQSRATHAHSASIWFVYVAENDGADYRVAVYFLPTLHNGRISHGECAYFRSATRDELDFMEKAGMSTVAIDSYTYIADNPSENGPLSAPSEANLPFRSPEQIPDADLPGILDAARTVFTARPASPPMPVLNIVAGPNGTVRVSFGWGAGPLSGHGIKVELQRNGSEFTVINVEQWQS